MITAQIGSKVTVAYASRDGSTVAVVGTVIDGRYPHLYLNIDIGTTVLSIPRDRITKVVTW